MILSYYSIFSKRCVITINVLSLNNLNNVLLIKIAVFGSILDVASSKQIISFYYNKILKKLIICFSPFDKLPPDYKIS